jgi:hypothetical protein
MGNPMTYTIGGYPVTEITGSFTVSNALPDNLSDVFINPVVFSFTDGIGNTVTNNTPLLEIAQFNFWTDSSGNITSWDLSFAGTNGLPAFTTYLLFQNTSMPNWFIASDEVLAASGPVLGESYTSDPGQWSCSGACPVAAPEPSSVVLTSTALLGFALAARRRRAYSRSVDTGKGGELGDSPRVS